MTKTNLPRLASEARFWFKVDQSAGPDGCWIWTGYTDKKGYGHMRRDSRGVLAHRFSYALANGPIPDGLFICHACDNPPCVNPDHLFAGTVTDNNRDMTTKGRHHYLDRTTCKNGHEWTPENTGYNQVNGQPVRFCRPCRRRHNSNYKRKKRAARRALTGR